MKRKLVPFLMVAGLIVGFFVVQQLRGAGEDEANGAARSGVEGRSTAETFRYLPAVGEIWRLTEGETPIMVKPDWNTAMGGSRDAQWELYQRNFVASMHVGAVFQVMAARGRPPTDYQVQVLKVSDDGNTMVPVLQGWILGSMVEGAQLVGGSPAVD